MRSTPWPPQASVVALSRVFTQRLHETNPLVQKVNSVDFGRNSSGIGQKGVGDRMEKDGQVDIQYMDYIRATKRTAYGRQRGHPRTRSSSLPGRKVTPALRPSSHESFQAVQVIRDDVFELRRRVTQTEIRRPGVGRMVSPAVLESLERRSKSGPNVWEDGYDENLLGDKDDQRRLMKMIPKERAVVLVKRRAKREELKRTSSQFKAKVKSSPKEVQMKGISPEKREPPEKRLKFEESPRDPRRRPTPSLTSTPAAATVSSRQSSVVTLDQSTSRDPVEKEKALSAYFGYESKAPPTEAEKETKSNAKTQPHAELKGFFGSRTEPARSSSSSLRPNLPNDRRVDTESLKRKHEVLLKRTPSVTSSRTIVQKDFRPNTKNNADSTFPYNYLNFIEALLDWDLKWDIDLSIPVNRVPPRLPNEYIYPQFLEWVPVMGQSFNHYLKWEQFRDSYIPRMLQECLQFIIKATKSHSRTSFNSNALLYKSCHKLDKYNYHGLDAIIQRDGAKAKFSKGDLVLVDFDERSKEQHLGLINHVNGYEDSMNVTMSGSLLNVIDEYNILINPKAFHGLMSLQEKGERAFEVTVVGNIKSRLLEVSAVFFLRNTFFQELFLRPDQVQVSRVPLPVAPGLTYPAFRDAVEYAVGFVTETWSMGPEKKIFCLTTDNAAVYCPVTQEIVRHLLHVVPRIRVLLVTVSDRLDEWRKLAQFFNVKQYFVSRRIDPAKEELKRMGRSFRRKLLNAELFVKSTKKLKPRERETVLDQIEGWVANKSNNISPYTALHLESFCTSSRLNLLREATITLGTYDEVVSEPAFRQMIKNKENGLHFDVCLVDEAHHLTELNVASLLPFRSKRLLVMGASVSPCPNSKFFLQRVVVNVANFMF